MGGIVTPTGGMTANTYQRPKTQSGLGMLAPVIGSAMGMIGQAQQQREQFRRTKELMGIQNKSQSAMMREQFAQQKLLNQQGSDLQFDMWNKTNYAAQVEQMKKAGLSVGMMYGGSGAGGATTGSQGGGSAASGSAAMGQAPQMIDIASQLQLSKLAAERKLIESQAAKTDAEKDRLKQDVTESQSRVKVNEGVITLNLSAEELNEVSARLKESEIEVNESVKKVNEALAKLNNQKVNESIKATEIDNKTLQWMEETGMHPSDTGAAKMINYLSRVTGIQENHLVYILGGAVGIRELMKLIPANIFVKGAKTVGGFAGGK